MVSHVYRYIASGSEGSGGSCFHMAQTVLYCILLGDAAGSYLVLYKYSPGRGVFFSNLGQKPHFGDSLGVPGHRPRQSQKKNQDGESLYYKLNSAFIHTTVTSVNSLEILQNYHEGPESRNWQLSLFK